MHLQAVELDLDLLGGINQDIRTVDKKAGAGAAVGQALLSGRAANPAIASRLGSGNRPAAAKNFNLHLSRLTLRPLAHLGHMPDALQGGDVAAHSDYRQGQGQKPRIKSS